MTLAFIWERFSNDQAFCFANLDRWLNLKKIGGLPTKTLMGVNEFNSRREAVAGGVINLGSWYGFNDILYLRRLEQIKKIEVFTNFQPNSYLWIYLGCDQNDCWAVRFSTRPEFPTGLFHILNSGRIKLIEKSDLLLPPGEHELSLERISSTIKIGYDQKGLFEATILMQEPILRFRNGLESVKILGVDLYDETGSVIKEQVHSNFDIVYFGVNLVIILTVLSGIIVFKSITTILVLRIESSLFAIILALSLLHLFDRYYWQERYMISSALEQESIQKRFFAKIEDARSALFEIYRSVPTKLNPFENSGWYPKDPTNHLSSVSFSLSDFQLILPNGTTHFFKKNQTFEDDLPKEKHFRLAFVGGSQTWGSGASHFAETWTSRLITEINSRFKTEVWGLNFAGLGGRVQDILDNWESIVRSNPHILIANIGFDDIYVDNTKYPTVVSKLINRAKEDQINLVILNEPNSYEMFIEGAEQMPGSLAIITTLAQQNQILTIEAFDYFHNPDVRDLGFIWKDYVHLSDLGHNLYSDFLLKHEKLNIKLKNIFGQ